MNINRLPLDFNSLPAVIQGMIEDSSHAAAIIDELIQEKGENKALTSLIILDDMNIRGVQISSLYKMCNQNINQLYEKITSMNKDDIEKLLKLETRISELEKLCSDVKNIPEKE